MSKLERLRNSLKNLEESKTNHFERIACFRKELSYIDSPSKKFELKKMIELDEKDICNLDLMLRGRKKE